MQKTTAASPAAESAEKLFFPPGFKQSVETAPAKARDAIPAKSRAAIDRYPPAAPPPPAVGASDEVDLPPAADLPPPVQASLASNFAGSRSTAAASEIEDLLPQSAGAIHPPTISADPHAPTTATITANTSAPKIDLDRRIYKERDRRRFLGNLIVWGACTLLLCLVLWLLVFSSR